MLLSNNSCWMFVYRSTPDRSLNDKSHHEFHRYRIYSTTNWYSKRPWSSTNPTIFNHQWDRVWNQKPCHPWRSCKEIQHRNRNPIRAWNKGENPILYQIKCTRPKRNRLWIRVLYWCTARHKIHDSLFYVHHGERIPRLNVKGFPFTSLATIVAYKLTLVYCYYLLCDLKLKSPRSKSAAPYKSDPQLCQFLNLIKSLSVPEYVCTLLNHTAPVLDNQKQNLKFIPTFAAFSFVHDWVYSSNNCILANTQHVCNVQNKFWPPNLNDQNL